MNGELLTDAQLHAFVDGALGEAERAAVEAYLASHPEDAARAAAYRAQNEAMHRAFDAVLDEPHALRVGAAPRRAAVPWRWAAALAATFVGGAVIGAVIQAGWSGRGMAAGPMPIARQAMIAHAAYLPEVRHPVEVDGSEEQHLVAWLSKRLGTSVRAPSLQAAGYRLLGGRLLPPAGEVGAAPVALFIYEDGRGRRLSLLVRREAAGGSTAFRFAQQGATNAFYWIDGPLGYALAGEVTKEDLSSVALVVYRELNP